LFADTHSKSGVEASNDEDYFEEEVRVQKNVLGLRFTKTNTGHWNVPSCTAMLFLQPEKGNSVTCTKCEVGLCVVPCLVEYHIKMNL
jgi:hypothetical protein